MKPHDSQVIDLSITATVHYQKFNRQGTVKNIMEYKPRLILTSSTLYEETHVIPSESIEITSVKDITTLRDFCTKILEEIENADKI